MISHCCKWPILGGGCKPRTSHLPQYDITVSVRHLPHYLQDKVVSLSINHLMLLLLHRTFRSYPLPIVLEGDYPRVETLHAFCVTAPMEVGDMNFCCQNQERERDLIHLAYFSQIPPACRDPGDPATHARPTVPSRNSLQECLQAVPSSLIPRKISSAIKNRLWDRRGVAMRRLCKGLATLW